jgi:hypothetical protein
MHEYETMKIRRIPGTHITVCDWKGDALRASTDVRCEVVGKDGETFEWSNRFPLNITVESPDEHIIDFVDGCLDNIKLKRRGR